MAHKQAMEKLRETMLLFERPVLGKHLIRTLQMQELERKDS